MQSSTPVALQASRSSVEFLTASANSMHFSLGGGVVGGGGRGVVGGRVGFGGVGFGLSIQTFNAFAALLKSPNSFFSLFLFFLHFLSFLHLLYAANVLVALVHWPLQGLVAGVPHSKRFKQCSELTDNGGHFCYTQLIQLYVSVSRLMCII